MGPTRPFGWRSSRIELNMAAVTVYRNLVEMNETRRFGRAYQIRELFEALQSTFDDLH